LVKLTAHDSEGRQTLWQIARQQKAKLHKKLRGLPHFTLPDGSAEKGGPEGPP
jgi:hypothetical protein